MASIEKEYAQASKTGEQRGTVLSSRKAEQENMFESAGPFAESTEAFPLGTRMTLGKRKIRRKSRDAWCSTLKSLRAYGTIFFTGAVPSDLRQTAYRQPAFSFIRRLE